MRIPVIITLLLLVVNQWTYSQVPGCMDPAAPNYNSAATSSNGTCSYAASNASLTSKAQLHVNLTEISGMTLVGNKIYAHNDGGNGVRNVLYEMDTTSGAITKTITLNGITNVDWEDITNDGIFIYIGDFGNNANGARTNLKFYRVPIAEINAITTASGSIASSSIQTISFTYEDQTQPPAAAGGNNTAFDCEAVVHNNGYLYLFTKNWVGDNTVQYRIPTTPGNHTARKLGEFDTEGILITSATMAGNNILLLLGYSKTAICKIFVISGFSDMDHLFETGNKRTINIGTALTNGQIEAIVAPNQTWALISNEYFATTNISPKLYSVSLQPFIPQYVLPFGIESFTARLNDNEAFLKWEYDAPDEVKEFVIETSAVANGNYTVVGKISASASRNSYEFVQYNLETSGTLYYRIKIVSLDGTIHYSKTLALKTDGTGLFNLTSMPSPFDNKIDISFYSDTQQLIQLTIVDLAGRTLKSQKLQAAKGQHTLSMDGLFNLTSGIYLLQARTGNQTFVRKIMKR